VCIRLVSEKHFFKFEAKKFLQHVKCELPCFLAIITDFFVGRTVHSCFWLRRIL